MRNRQKVFGPVNHPQVKAYQSLWRRFDKERKSAKTIYEQIALGKAAKVMMLAARLDSRVARRTGTDVLNLHSQDGESRVMCIGLNSTFDFLVGAVTFRRLAGAL